LYSVDISLLVLVQIANVQKDIAAEDNDFL